VVKIDGMAPECPFNKSHFLEIVKSLVLGKKLPVVDYNVCAECKLKENNCLLDQGKCCLGPVVMGGCGAICPTHGYTCEGCRGPSEDAKVDTLDAFMKIVEDRKIPKDEAIKKLRKYAGAVDPFRGKKK
jgi:sulfhydrogenase subunit delta